MAFPFAPVGPDAVGGAEQVLTLLDAGLTARGHRSIVVACAGSRTRGTLVETPAVRGAVTEAVREAAWGAHRIAIARALDRYAVDLVHLHGIDFWATLPPPGVPALATLHLPPGWYPRNALTPVRPRTWLNPVSAAQAAHCPAGPRMLAPIGNGVPVDALGPRITRRGYALVLGRICPEKNFADALDAGTRAGVPVLLGGEVFPYTAHAAYHREQILPRVAGGPHRFLGPIGFARKRRLLAGARCLLSASVAPETSSLVAMEALASGTPVIAYPSGALAEIITHGQTGFLVRDVAEMADAIRNAGRIDPDTCRGVARERFSADMMVARYAAAYEAILHG